MKKKIFNQISFSKTKIFVIVEKRQYLLVFLFSFSNNFFFYQKNKMSLEEKCQHYRKLYFKDITDTEFSNILEQFRALNAKDPLQEDVKIVLKAIRKFNKELRALDPNDPEEKKKNDNLKTLYVWIKFNERNLGTLQNKHPIPEFDPYVSFDEEEHLYTVYGMVHRSSMTSFVHSFFEGFDQEGTIKRIVRSARWRNNPDYKYYQMSSEDISNEWKANGLDASFRGTIFHASCEYMYNGLNHALFEKRHLLGEEYTWFHLFHMLEVEGKLIPWRTELSVFDCNYEIAGQVDMLYYQKDRTDDKELIMYDWKRSKEIKYEAFDKRDFGKGPCQGMPNSNLYHYYCQLNGYKYLIEKNTKYRIKEMYIAAFHPNHATIESRTERSKRDNIPVSDVPPYLKIRVPDLQKQIRVMMEIRRHNLIIGDIRTITDQIQMFHDRYTEKNYRISEKDSINFLRQWHLFHRLSHCALKCLHGTEETGKMLDLCTCMVVEWTMAVDNEDGEKEERKGFSELYEIWFKQNFFKRMEETTFKVNSDSFKYTAYNVKGLGIPKHH